MKPQTLYKYMNQVAPYLTERKYCTTCMTERVGDTFTAIRRNNTTRYVCSSCMQKRSESWVNRSK
jgi:hypothetical protein